MNRFLKSRGLGVLAVPVLAVMMAACSSSSRAPAPQAVASTAARTASSAAADFIGSAPNGASAAYVLPEFGGQVELVAGTTYYAASGRTCRSFLARGAGGTATHGVACLTPAGWHIAPPISAGGSL